MVSAWGDKRDYPPCDESKTGWRDNQYLEIEERIPRGAHQSYQARRRNRIPTHFGTPDTLIALSTEFGGKWFVAPRDIVTMWTTLPSGRIASPGAFYTICDFITHRH